MSGSSGAIGGSSIADGGKSCGIYGTKGGETSNDWGVCMGVGESTRRGESWGDTRGISTGRAAGEDGTAGTCAGGKTCRGEANWDEVASGKGTRVGDIKEGTGRGAVGVSTDIGTCKAAPEGADAG